MFFKLQHWLFNMLMFLKCFKCFMLNVLLTFVLIFNLLVFILLLATLTNRVDGGERWDRIVINSNIAAQFYAYLIRSKSHCMQLSLLPGKCG